ncbi:sensor histidine kinase [Paenibacillus whitsoniae]|uniref:histidine kinase n=1 Tax=Paenibacillus whitsoniae TaxID=2496558 RepID=A0A3S0A0M8_9BACL|nr:histidine kinase [Paenibacillus whitsoniae]RTE04379.1 sensor histidine kinase [Paenibacillus whitsoniae]
MRLRTLFQTFLHMRIRTKLSILITLIIAVSLSFTIALQQYAFSIYDGQIYDKSSRVLNLSSKAIETELKRIQQLSFRLMSEDQVQNWLNALKANPSDYDKHLLSQLLTDKLISYAGEEPHLYSIQLIDAFGSEYAGGNMISQDPNKRKSILDKAAEGTGESRWMFPDAVDAALILTREIRSFHSSNFDLSYLGTLEIRINIEKIIQDLAPAEGDLIIASGNSIIFPRAQPFSLSEIEAAFTDGKGYTNKEINGEEYFITRIQSANSGWTYINVTPFKQIFDRILFIKELVVFVFIGIFIVVFAIGIRFSYSLTKPIEELMARMKLAEKGNFEEANLLASGGQVSMNEIGLLQRSFRFMIERINTLIQENYTNRLLIKETEFKALQSQINPHFLYNTLESINWMAKVNKQSEISAMVEALAHLLRNSIDLKEPIIPLREELDIVQSYVTIQKMRFEDRLQFELEVPEAMLACPIPKLTLQPLMENAIHYALETIIDPCRITIRGWRTEGNVFLSVEDTGPGMPPGILDRLRNGEIRTKGKGIGLLNIDDRIKLAFGDMYGIQIDDNRTEGAIIVLRLPGEGEAIS